MTTADKFTYKKKIENTTVKGVEFNGDKKHTNNKQDMK